MRRLTIAAIGALVLSGCTGAHIRNPAVCNGKHRRPANLYGSILPTLPVPFPVSQGGGQSMVAPGPDSAPGALPPPQTGAAAAPTSAPRTSKRDVALSYLPC